MLKKLSILVVLGFLAVTSRTYAFQEIRGYGTQELTFQCSFGSQEGGTSWYSYRTDLDTIFEDANACPPEAPFDVVTHINSLDPNGLGKTAVFYEVDNAACSLLTRSQCAALVNYGSFYAMNLNYTWQAPYGVTQASVALTNMFTDIGSGFVYPIVTVLVGLAGLLILGFAMRKIYALIEPDGMASGDAKWFEAHQSRKNWKKRWKQIEDGDEFTINDQWLGDRRWE